MRTMIRSVGCLLAVSLVMSTAVAGTPPKPNIVLILVDDMGYSDLGCFGSEISTPNIDRLASGGIRFANFTNCAKCETSRATLMSGRYHPEVKSQGSRSVITIPEILALGGYQNFMVGKWHIFDSPNQRGFERFYGFPNGCCTFFTCEADGKPMLQMDGKFVPVPDDFYATKDFTDAALTFVDERDKAKPFFMYVAYNAPHYPLQAPKEDVLKYRGKYRDGWHALRASRLKRMKELGVVPPEQVLSPASQEPWDSLSEEDRDRQDLLMATFAAMIDVVDQNVGRLVQKLKTEGIYDDTLIVFLSDNGACPFDRTKPASLENNYMPWDPRSYYCYTASWANACNTPFRKYKQNQHEGGISTPLIAHWPAGIERPDRFDRDRAHLVDLHATFRELAGVPYPSEYKGNAIGPARGLSLAKAFKAEPRPLHDELFYVFYGKYSALQQGHWKLVDREALYDLSVDRIESKDLSEAYPERFEAMKSRWLELRQAYGGKRKSGSGSGK